jgi:hypothetical protein
MQIPNAKVAACVNAVDHPATSVSDVQFQETAVARLIIERLGLIEDAIGIPI